MPKLKYLWILATVAATQFVAAQYTPGPGVSPSMLATGTISSAQILAASPIALVLAGGSGTLVIVEQMQFQLVTGTAYSGTAALNFIYGSSGGAAGGTCTSAFLTSATDAICTVLGANQANLVAANILNQPLNINFTAMDTNGTGTVKYWIKFHVITGAS